MDNSKTKHNIDHLGVNKTGKNIRKSPLHQPSFLNGTNTANNNPMRQQPQVYNISKNDFRSVVQQLTGSPSHDLMPRPPYPPKSQSLRLQKIRPPPLPPINRPHMPLPLRVPTPQPPLPVPYNNYPRPAQFGGPLPHHHAPAIPVAGPPGDPYSLTPTESPVQAYMRYLQASMFEPSPVGNPTMPLPQPRALGPMPTPPPHQPMLSSGTLPNPTANFHPYMNGPAFLPSPTSQFLLPSPPSSYLNLLSPRSPYPLLSPGVQFPPLSPNFSFSPLAQSGILGRGPQPPPSPGIMFPLSPGFFTIPSPRWRDQ
ncbi:hypothetical protein SAY87_012812 [Trapa incisa]|uniref:VQ domain-containing protein n=1 Tax=Trapa incisa TaxID=236973 RepID=A0AAN7JK38_9MYRT|nr:hypothetical protein SAY87_012812 [Trapa incisa]